jgi:uncharacterized protein YjbI with pentapeptide repeats
MFISGRRIPALLAFATLALTLAAVPVLSSAAQPRGAKPRVQKISILYVVDAGKGTLRPAGKGYRLTLGNLARNAVWFSDRPARNSGSFPTAGIVAGWEGLGFAADPPNAALVYDDAQGAERTAILELSQPRLQAKAGKLSFRVRPVGANRAGRNLAAHARSADGLPAAAFRDASLFIDNAQGLAWENCVLEPFSVCENHVLETGYANPFLAGIDLRGTRFENVGLGNNDFSNANFEAAVFDRVGFSGSNFTGANLRNVRSNGTNEWLRTNLTNAEAEGADLANAQMFESTAVKANFTDAILSGAEMQRLNAEGANFSGANLANALLYSANLSGANLKGANLSGANLGEANLYGTTMPNGSTCFSYEGPAGCSLSE